MFFNEKLSGGFIKTSGDDFVRTVILNTVYINIEVLLKIDVKLKRKVFLPFSNPFDAMS